MQDAGSSIISLRGSCWDHLFSRGPLGSSRGRISSFLLKPQKSDIQICQCEAKVKPFFFGIISIELSPVSYGFCGIFGSYAVFLYHGCLIFLVEPTVVFQLVMIIEVSAVCVVLAAFLGKRMLTFAKGLGFRVL